MGWGLRVVAWVLWFGAWGCALGWLRAPLTRELVLKNITTTPKYNPDPGSNPDINIYIYKPPFWTRGAQNGTRVWLIGMTAFFSHDLQKKLHF